MTTRIIVLFTIFMASSVNAEDFTGSWSVIYPKKGSKQYDDHFDLHLIQRGNKVCGLHFGSARGLAKIDSSFGSEAKSTVSGTVNENYAKIIILSSQSDIPIEGTIRHQGNRLNWQVSSPEKHRTITIPKNAALKSIPPANLGYNDLTKLCSE